MALITYDTDQRVASVEVTAKSSGPLEAVTSWTVILNTRRNSLELGVISIMPDGVFKGYVMGKDAERPLSADLVRTSLRECARALMDEELGRPVAEHLEILQNIKT